MSVLDFDIKSIWTPANPLGRFRFLVEFRPTREDLAALGGRGVHTNWFFVDGSRKDRLEASIRDYWQRKLRAADAGRPYAQHHKTTLLLTVTDGDDDADHLVTDANCDSTNTTIRVVSPITALPNLREWMGTRFQNVTIAQGSTITACVWRGFCISSDDIRSDIYFNDVDDAANFVTEATVTGRTLTSASVLWDQSNVGLNQFNDSPSLVTPCQEVISRAGWASGQALCVVFKPRFATTRVYTVASFENATFDPPELDIDYEGPAATAPIEILAYMGDRP